METMNIVIVKDSNATKVKTFETNLELKEFVTRFLLDNQNNLSKEILFTYEYGKITHNNFPLAIESKTMVTSQVGQKINAVRLKGGCNV